MAPDDCWGQLNADDTQKVQVNSDFESLMLCDSHGPLMVLPCDKAHQGQTYMQQIKQIFILLQHRKIFASAPLEETYVIHSSRQQVSPMTKGYHLLVQLVIQYLSHPAWRGGVMIDFKTCPQHRALGLAKSKGKPEFSEDPTKPSQA